MLTVLFCRVSENKSAIVFKMHLLLRHPVPNPEIQCLCLPRFAMKASAAVHMECLYCPKSGKWAAGAKVSFFYSGKSWYDKPNNQKQKKAFSSSDNSQYFFTKISGICPWVSRINWCKGHWWCYMVGCQALQCNLKKGVKTQCIFTPFLSLRWTAWPPY